jgi:hypothetical protein
MTLLVVIDLMSNGMLQAPYHTDLPTAAGSHEDVEA